jgi:hypothetical protein
MCGTVLLVRLGGVRGGGEDMTIDVLAGQVVPAASIHKTT